MSGVEDSLEKIVLVSDSDVSKIERSMSDFDYVRKTSAEAALNEKEPKIVVYVSKSKAWHRRAKEWILCGFER